MSEIDFMAYEAATDRSRSTPEPGARWYWRCTRCPHTTPGATGSAATHTEARQRADHHLTERHPT